MVRALLDIFHSSPFQGPQKPPKRWDKPDQKPQKLLTREFILLFLMAMCSNSFIAVYYCFEQWMQVLGINPAWRGILLSSLFAMIFLVRPLASVVMIKHGKLWPMVISLAVCVLVMLAYPFVKPENAVLEILILRMVQGVALAIYSACTVAILVDCIPPGQSARGFALFSLTMLLPYSIIPALSEELLPLFGGEARLFANMAWLGLPSFIMLFLMAKRIQQPDKEMRAASRLTRQQLMHAITHSGLGWVYTACLFFSIMTTIAIFYMKGLCQITGDHPAIFFSTYSVTIILVRIFGSHLMDTLPRHKVSIFCSAILFCCMLGFAYAPSWSFMFLAAIYGLSLGLLYPLLAAAVYDRSTLETRSINSNVMMAAFDLSGMIGPVLGGLVIDWGFGYRGVFNASAITIALCGLAMLIDGVRLNKQKRLAAEKKSV